MEIPFRSPPYFEKIARLLHTNHPDYALHSREIILFGMGFARIGDWEFIDRAIVPPFQKSQIYDEERDKILEELLQDENSMYRYYAAILSEAVFIREGYSSIHHDPLLYIIRNVALNDPELLPRVRASMTIVTAMKGGAELGNEKRFFGGFLKSDLDRVLKTLYEGIGRVPFMNIQSEYKPYIHYVEELKEMVS